MRHTWDLVSFVGRGCQCEYPCNTPCLPNVYQYIYIYTYIYMNAEITFDWTRKQFATRVHTIFYLLQDIPIHKWQWKQDPHTSTPFHTRSVHVLLMTSQLIVDNVIITRHCDPITWKVKSNLLDIDFIYGDIGFRSGFSQFVNYMYMRFIENDYVSGDRKSRQFVLISHTKTSNLTSFYHLRDLMGNIS